MNDDSAALMQVCKKAVLLLLASASMLFAQSGPLLWSLPPSDTVVARVGGASIKASEINAVVTERSGRIANDLYTLYQLVLQEEINKRIAAMEASNKKASSPSAVRSDSDGELGELTDAEARLLLEFGALRLNPGSGLDILSEVKREARRIREERRAMLMARELQTKYGVEISLPPFRLPFDITDQPVTASGTSPVTLVMVADFECPYCRKMYPVLKELRSKYGDKLKLVFHNSPLPRHQDGRYAASVSVCAADQGRFWPLYDKLFEAPNLSRSVIDQSVRDIALDGDRYQSCMKSAGTNDRVERHIKYADSLGIRNTPTFLINGRIVTGAVPSERLSAMIDEELGGGGRAVVGAGGQ